MTTTWRIAVGLVALLLCLGATACGGDDDEGAGTTTEETTTEETTTTETGGGTGSAEGREVFVANCGSCHTLEDAGTSGAIGPNLDELSVDEATVEAQVRSGGGGMPAFEGQLSDEEIMAVAGYVVSARQG
jgi:mono/diheme cytochrome c family protein